MEEAEAEAEAEAAGAARRGERMREGATLGSALERVGGGGGGGELSTCEKRSVMDSAASNSDCVPLGSASDSAYSVVAVRAVLVLMFRLELASCACACACAVAPGAAPPPNPVLLLLLLLLLPGAGVAAALRRWLKVRLVPLAGAGAEVNGKVEGAAEADVGAGN